MNSRGVEYLVVGGHAVAFHGYPRYTGDVDFWLRPTPQNAARVLSVLQTFGFGDVGLRESDFVARDRIVQLGNPPNRIDLLTGISGVDFDEAWSTRLSADLDALPVAFISFEVLLKINADFARARFRA